MTKLLDGAIHILLPCSGRRAIAVAGVRSRKARVHNDRIGRMVHSDGYQKQAGLWSILGYSSAIKRLEGASLPAPVAKARRRPRPAGTAAALCLGLTLACAHRHGPTDLQGDGLTKALDALERKVCLTIGDRTNGPKDRCEPHVDRSTYLRPLRDVFSAAPPVLKAYLCSLDRLYVDYHSPWNASFAVLSDSQTGHEYRSIAVRRGALENKVRYTDWATAWTQHWWTGGPIDRPGNDPSLPRVEIESRLSGPGGTLYHLVAHEVGHLLDRDYGGGLRRRPDDKPFAPGEFGYLSWILPRYVGANGVVHQAVARDSALQAVRELDFDGNVRARIAMLAAAGDARSVDPGALAVQSWQPASRDGIATFLDRLDHSPFTTVFSTWRPEDDWTESFVAMMLPSVARRFDIVTANGTRVRVLSKVLDDASPFAPKRRFIQGAIDRAMKDFRARQAASPNPCLAVALAESPAHQASFPWPGPTGNAPHKRSEHG